MGGVTRKVGSHPERAARLQESGGGPLLPKVVQHVAELLAWHVLRLGDDGANVPRGLRDKVGLVLPGCRGSVGEEDAFRQCGVVDVDELVATSDGQQRLASTRKDVACHSHRAWVVQEQ
eukprot:5869435-Heterocapsa_arctica.AAC.1